MTIPEEEAQEEAQESNERGPGQCLTRNGDKPDCSTR